MSTKTIIATSSSSFLERLLMYTSKTKAMILFCIAFLLYSNTLLNEFALDDGIVITQNDYVKKGFSGIPDILSKDTFRGFFKKEGKDKLVAGGRYRPITLVCFAIIYQVAGESSFLFHLFSILAFSFLVVVIYNLIKKLLSKTYKDEADTLAFITALLYAIHPIHTECVANIKGLDETFALLLPLLAFYFTLVSLDTNKLIELVKVFVLFVLGLFSKENAIVYFLLIPLGVYFFYGKNTINVKSLFTLGIACLIFLLIRGSILGWNMTGTASNELMNNPFLKVQNGVYTAFDFSEKMGTVFYTLGKYIILLIAPHPLTHDYYPKHIEMQSLSSLPSLMSLLFYILLLFFVFRYWKTKPIISYSILLYLIPLFLVSNLLFPVGTFMGERFLFMPSLGFCLLAAYLIIQIKSNTVKQVLLASILLLFSVKTFTRNFVWKNDKTLFTTDVQVSKNSAKINNAVGGVTLEALAKENDTAVINKTADRAIKYLNKAIEIHPSYTGAYLLRGNAYFYKKQYSKAIEQYKIVVQQTPEDTETFKNLQLAYRESGRMKGSVYGDVEGAKIDLQQAISMDPKDEESMMLLGIAEGVSKNYQAAINYFDKVIALNPRSAQCYYNLYITYSSIANKQKAEESLQAALAIDPEIIKKNSGQ